MIKCCNKLNCFVLICCYLISIITQTYHSKHPKKTYTDLPFSLSVSDTSLCFFDFSFDTLLPSSSDCLLESELELRTDDERFNLLVPNCNVKDLGDRDEGRNNLSLAGEIDRARIVFSVG